MLGLYSFITRNSESFLNRFLANRLQKGKEDAARLPERKGRTSLPRPIGKLFWVHGASVGESQSALILVQKLLALDSRLNILMTSGTVTSAQYLATKLPERTIHQFYPVDHPAWTKRFLDHWHPDAVFWMESELWPNMLLDIQKRKIPAALINARLSKKSYRFWRLFKISAKKLLTAFEIIIAQTPRDRKRFKKLGHAQTFVSDNIKFSAKPLSCNEDDLKQLVIALNNRPCWVFASTHAGEEELACRVHQLLKNTHPELLTIIVPRHPQRGIDIESIVQKTVLKICRRTSEKNLPDYEDDIYIADTLGELGLFYRLAPIACIGRSFSDDGGGGHNPIEAAQLHAAVLHGPHVQFQQDIYDEMQDAEAAFPLRNERDLIEFLNKLLSDPDACKKLRDNGTRFARYKEGAIDRIMEILTPLIQKALKP